MLQLSEATRIPCLILYCIGGALMIHLGQCSYTRAMTTCSLDELSGCFRRVFHRFNRSRVYSCDDYKLFAYCYDNPSCNDNQSAAIASKIYREATSEHLPKQFFAALHQHWKSKCQMKPCDKYNEAKCRRSMIPVDKDYDHALLLEWHGQRLQFELGMVPSSRGCSNLRSTMSRWHAFRTNKCPKETIACYCQEQQNRLGSYCALSCDSLKLKASSSSVRLIAVFHMYIIHSLLVYLTIYS